MISNQGSVAGISRYKEVLSAYCSCCLIRRGGKNWLKCCTGTGEDKGESVADMRDNALGLNDVEGYIDNHHRWHRAAAGLGMRDATP